MVLTREGCSLRLGAADEDPLNPRTCEPPATPPEDDGLKLDMLGPSRGRINDRIEAFFPAVDINTVPRLAHCLIVRLTTIVSLLTIMTSSETMMTNDNRICTSFEG